jgi:hypothetical protein
MENYNPKTSDISHISEQLGSEDERFERLIEIGRTLYKPVINVFGKVIIEEHTVINARNALDRKLLIVLKGKNESSQIVHWKSIKYNFEMGCYFSRKEDAIYIVKEHLRKIVIDSDKLIAEL